MKKTIYFYGSIISLVILAGCASTHIHNGNKYYNGLAFDKAIPYYEKVYFKNPTSEVGIKLADSYFKTGKLEAAEAVYEKVVSVAKTKNIQYFNYAKVLMANNKHVKAKQILQDRIVKQMIDENEEISEDGILAEPVIRENIDFDKEEKVTSVALDEFLDGDIDWNKTEESIEH